MYFICLIMGVQVLTSIASVASTLYIIKLMYMYNSTVSMVTDAKYYTVCIMHSCDPTL